jgi:hypothetical protein
LVKEFTKDSQYGALKQSTALYDIKTFFEKRGDVFFVGHCETETIGCVNSFSVFCIVVFVKPENCLTYNDQDFVRRLLKYVSLCVVCKKTKDCLFVLSSI